MDLPSNSVFEALDAKGVKLLHHANSVLTASHFILAGGLLSRGTVEGRGLRQTPQLSDTLDKRNSIWFDVFADSVDIHSRASRRNLYGPVLFVLDAAIIKHAYTGRVWVTKLNPTKWQGKGRARRWFQSKEDLDENFTYGTFDYMVVFRHCGGVLPFTSFLREIVVDDPSIETDDGADLYSIAYGALRLAMAGSGREFPIRRRACTPACLCRAEYGANSAMAHSLFVPDVS